MFSCCLQKQKAVCPLHYLTPLHFRSTVGENLKDIVPPPSQKWPKSLAISYIVILFVLNALTSLQAERVVAIVRFTCFFVCAVHINTTFIHSMSVASLVFVLDFLSFPFLFSLFDYFSVFIRCKSFLSVSFSALCSPCQQYSMFFSLIS